jgi:hypothetical protein
MRDHGETTTYYFKGCRCEPCRVYTNAVKAKSRRKLGVPERGYDHVEEGMPELVIDILETFYGEWWTIERLRQEATRIRGEDISPKRMTAAVNRLVKAGRVEHRKAEVGYSVNLSSAFLRRGQESGEATQVFTVTQVMRPRREYLFEGSESPIGELLTS